jgi:hypothetical protein
LRFICGESRYPSDAPVAIATVLPSAPRYAYALDLQDVGYNTPVNDREFTLQGIRR